MHEKYHIAAKKINAGTICHNKVQLLNLWTMLLTGTVNGREKWPACAPLNMQQNSLSYHHYYDVLPAQRSPSSAWDTQLWKGHSGFKLGRIRTAKCSAGSNNRVFNRQGG